MQVNLTIYTILKQQEEEEEGGLKVNVIKCMIKVPPPICNLQQRVRIIK